MLIMYLNLQLILNQVQIEIPPDLLQVEENDMVRLIISSPAAACAQNCLAVPLCILLVHVLKIEIPLALIIFICM